MIHATFQLCQIANVINLCLFIRSVRCLPLLAYYDDKVGTVHKSCNFLEPSQTPSCHLASTFGLRQMRQR